MAIAAARRGNRDEDRLTIARAHDVGGKCKTALPHVGFDQIGEPGLEDRHFAAIERGYPLLVLFNAGDLMTEIGKASTGDEADIIWRRSWRHASKYPLPF